MFFLCKEEAVRRWYTINGNSGRFGDGCGGLYNDGTAMLNGCTLSGNSADRYGAGGLENHGIAMLTGCALSGNLTHNDGGGLFNWGTATKRASVMLTDCTLSGNTANHGGGLINVDGTATLADCTVGGNHVLDWGGGLYNHGTAATLTMTDCTVSGNSTGVSGEGGGLYNQSGTAILTACTVSGNSAGRDGGLYNSGTAMLADCTLSGNSALRGAGGIDNSGTATLTGTIVARQASGADIGNTGTLAGSYNLIGDGTGQAGLVNGANGNQVGTAAHPIDPLLAPLGNYGGPTRTMALLPGSPAIDAGDPARLHSADQRGLGQVGRRDIGAFESQGFALAPVAGSTPQSAVIGAAFANPLAVVVAANNPVEPVDGGVVRFAVTPAAGGASAALSAAAAAISGGRAGVTARANAIAGSYAATASAAGATSARFALTNTYQVVAAFDQGKVHESGSTIPIKLRVTDVRGRDVGSPSLTVTGVSVIGPEGEVPLQSPGNSQSGGLFKFDPSEGIYQFNLKTTGYKPGTYTFYFTIGNDPTTHGLTVRVR